MSPTQLNNHLLSWAPDLDPNAWAQAERVSKLPFISGHVALMPDAHWGMGATIGSVIPTLGAIIPSAVGVDIGCGMIAARLNMKSSSLPDDLTDLHSAIAKAVPAGVGKGHAKVIDAIHNIHVAITNTLMENERLVNKARLQFGSLGSGNHFIEICLDEGDNVWIVLHSGSRGVGNELAKMHIEGAKGMMKSYFIELEDPDLAYLVNGTESFDSYIADMFWAQEYAMHNREAMLDLVLRCVQDVIPQVTIAEQINCHHNFTQLEHHHGKDLWITRKGAIRARMGDRGVIPGSMGTKSYIVTGLGNTASYCSCSHGAGRRLGRKQAKRELTYASLEVAMEGKTWNHDEALLDEHPDAYKDIDVVMENQRDLVTIEHTLHQILNYKGT